MFKHVLLPTDGSNLVDYAKLNFHLISLVNIYKMCYQNCRLFGINLPKPCNF